MEEERNDGFELDVFQLLGWIWENILLIVLVSAIFGLATFGYTYFRVTPKYEASTTLYVNSSSFSIGATSFSVSSSELSTSKNLVNTYLLVLQSRTTLERINEQAGLNLSPKALKGMLSAKQVEGTAAFVVTVSSTSPTQAELIANTVANVLPDRISEIVFGTSVQVIDYAIVPSSSTYPNYTSSTLIGVAVGFALSTLCVLAWNALRELRSGVVASASDLKKLYADIPVFAVIPDIRYRSGKSYYDYYYSYGNEKKNGAKKA